jgi:hypothetical protein
MIGVGINKNVVISKAGFTDKKQLFIELNELDRVGSKEKSVFDELLTAGVTNDAMGMQLSFHLPVEYLMPKAVDRNGNPVSQEKRREMVGNDLKRFKNQVFQILEQFMTHEKIDINTVGVLYDGTGIVDGNSFNDRILDGDVLNKIYENVGKRFIELITPYLNDTSSPLRFKLIRQSKEKHYASIPGRFIADNPFVDLMSVPDDQTKVKFSAWEVKEGLDNATPVAAASAENKATATASASELVADNPFAPPTT